MSTSVGYGGLPNEQGRGRTRRRHHGRNDASRGLGLQFHKIKNPISVARLSWKRRVTRRWRVKAHCSLQSPTDLPDATAQPRSPEAWLRWKNDPKHETFWIDAEHHDTIGMLASRFERTRRRGVFDQRARVEIPGRVADSPLVGCGYYADDDAGARPPPATAT